MRAGYLNGLWAAATSTILVLTGCGGDSNTTNNFSGCGPGTTMDPGTKLCVPVDDGGAGSGGAAGAGGQGGTEQDGSAGTAGSADQDAGDAQEEIPAPDPNDDTCITGAQVIINGDKACGDYKPAGICDATEPGTVVLPALDYKDISLPNPNDPSSGGTWVRTPSHPGANPDCESGCYTPGTVAKILVPIRISTTFFPALEVIHEDGNNPVDPWRISVLQNDNPPPLCRTNTAAGCYYAQSIKSIDVIIETWDPDAPARNFHLFEQIDHNGACQ